MHYTWYLLSMISCPFFSDWLIKSVLLVGECRCLVRKSYQSPWVIHKLYPCSSCSYCSCTHFWLYDSMLIAVPILMIAWFYTYHHCLYFSRWQLVHSWWCPPHLHFSVCMTHIGLYAWILLFVVEVCCRGSLQVPWQMSENEHRGRNLHSMFQGTNLEHSDIPMFTGALKSSSSFLVPSFFLLR